MFESFLFEDYMKIFWSKLMFLLVAISVAACSNDTFIDDSATVEPSGNVRIAMPLAIDSRTTIDPDGMTTRWATGDKAAVWARNEAGEFVFSGVQFMMHHYSREYDYAFFDGNVAAMAEGTYDYFMSYPMPKSVDGTKVTYNLPAKQDGSYTGKNDIMVATPTTAEALSAEGTVLNTTMHHQMHAIKIVIPEGRNLFGYNFTRLEITFPNAVVGDITFDVTDPDAEPTYTNTSNTIILENSNGFAEGADIWAFVLPGTVDGDVSYRVEGEERQSVTNSYALSKSMLRGHITPIRMATPELYLYTSFVLSEGASYLGEDFNSFEVYDFNNSLLATFTRNAENRYEFGFEGEIDYTQWQNTDLRIVFDSDHAIVENSLNLGTITPYKRHTLEPMVVPYLFEEDFSTIAKYEQNIVTGAQGTTTTAYDLSAATYGLSSGWTGARTGGEAGVAIRVGGRVDEVVLGTTRTYGRIDSPALTGIKSGVTTGVKVSFDYSGGRDGSDKFAPWAKIGYHTTSGNIKGHTTTFNDNWKTNNVSGEVDLGDITITNSFASITQSMTVNFSGFTSAHRLAWIVTGSGRSYGITNGNNWIYVDNIKVQIAN